MWGNKQISHLNILNVFSSYLKEEAILYENCDSQQTI